jgi:hypothetical protein
LVRIVIKCSEIRKLGIAACVKAGKCKGNNKSGVSIQIAVEKLPVAQPISYQTIWK